MPLCFLALIPPKPIKEEIRSLKEEIYQKYGAKRALRLPAHITLQPPFKIETSQLPVLHNTIREFTRTHHPFLIDIKGFGAFPPRVIFIEVVNPGEIKKLQKQLKEILQKDLLAREDETREFRPHITLATRDLPRNKFRSAWEEFRNRKFEKTFKAEGIFLFEHNGKTWDLSTEFRFLS